MLALVASAQDSIKPFGSLAWTNGFGEVVSKLNSIEGIESVTFSLGRGSESVSLKGESELARLGELIIPVLKDAKFYFFDDERRNDDFVKSMLGSWVDANGKRHFYLKFDYQLTVKPIIIEGVPFTLTASFKPSPGFGLKHPNKVVPLKGFDYELPLLLTGVILKSESPALTEKHKAITETLIAKYKNHRGKIILETEDLRKPSGEAKILDAEGRMWFAKRGATSYLIQYESEAETALLDKEYQKHLSELEGKGLKGKKDLKSDL
jgi:hypothetical protein